MNFIEGGRGLKWRKKVAVGASAVALLSSVACESSKPTAIPSVDVTSTVVPKRTVDIDADKLEGPCKPPDKKKKKESAENCLRAEQKGKIALVDFSTSSENASIAGVIETYVEAATDGLITPNITIVPASTEAKIVHKNTVYDSKGCQTTDDPKKFASYAADKKMDLQKYDMVIALTPEKACKPIAGVADTGSYRRADVFVSDDQKNSEDFKEKGSTAGHELLHLYRLGHAGSFKFLPFYQGGEPINLQRILKCRTYLEYGDTTNIMGSDNPFGDGLPRSNAIQREYLRWPQAEITGNEVLKGFRIGKKWKNISFQQAKDGVYGTIKLNKEVILSDPEIAKLTDGEAGGPKSFDTLAFVPQVDQMLNRIPGVKMYLTDTENIVEIGTILPYEPVKFKLGSKTIEVNGTFDKASMRVSS